MVVKSRRREKLYTYIYLKSRETERNIFYLCVYLTNVLSSQDLAKLQPGVKNFIYVFHMDVRNPDI